MPKNMIGMSKEENNWRAEDDLRTLIEAEKIKQDKSRIKAAMEKKRQLKKALDGMEG